jgi:predicted component of type VI protein secretion system
MHTTRLLAVTATALLLSLTACSDGSDGGSPDAATAMDGGAAGGSAGDMAVESAPEAPADAAAASREVGAASNAVDLTTQQALIKTGAVSLRSADVGGTRYDVQVPVDEQGGQVADDKTETDKSGEPLRARMVLRVPVDSFEDVMNALGSMETLASTSTSSEDVTTQLIDVEARIKAQQASVERVRQLLAQAQSIRDIMAIESELAQRQAELDSLAQQQAYLKDQTSMATVKVNIERKPDPKAPVTEDDDSGFLAGLAAGWDGLTTTMVAVATVVGAVLPFAVVVLLVGIPVWLLVRRIRRSPAVPAQTEASQPST